MNPNGGHNTPVARSSFARLCSTAKRNILVTNFDHHSAWVATPFGDSHLGALSGVCSHVRSLLLGSSLLEAFNPIDGPEVLGQVLLSDPGVGHVEVALVSPVLAPGIAHLRCVGGLEVCWLSASTQQRGKKIIAVIAV